jgi:hypothetical protein
VTGPQRAADADREQAVAALRDHAVAGRLTLEELADRVGNALTATTRGELDAVLGDLPAEAATPAGDDPSRVLALFGDVSGGVRLDLRGAEGTGGDHGRGGCGVRRGRRGRAPRGRPRHVRLRALRRAERRCGRGARARTAFGSLTVRRG